MKAWESYYSVDTSCCLTLSPSWPWSRWSASSYSLHSESSPYLQRLGAADCRPSFCSLPQPTGLLRKALSPPQFWWGIPAPRPRPWRASSVLGCRQQQESPTRQHFATPCNQKQDSKEPFWCLESNTISPWFIPVVSTSDPDPKMGTCPSSSSSSLACFYSWAQFVIQKFFCHLMETNAMELAWGTLCRGDFAGETWCGSGS